MWLRERGRMVSNNDEADSLPSVEVQCLPKRLTWKTIEGEAGVTVDESSIIKSLVYMHDIKTNLYAVAGYLNHNQKGTYASDVTLLPISVYLPPPPFFDTLDSTSHPCLCILWHSCTGRG